MEHRRAPPSRQGYTSNSSDDEFIEGDAHASTASRPSHGLRLLEVIGKGGHGVVHRAIWQGRLVAAKVVELDNAEGKTDDFCPYDLGNTLRTEGQVQINGVLMEGAMSLIMQHPNIVRSLGYQVVPKEEGASSTAQEIHLLMEFCDRGSLLQAISDGCFDMWVNNKKEVNMRHLLRTLMEVAYAMQHLHSMHILHRDLKIQNVLLKSSNKDRRGFTVKVSDFGLAKIWSEANGSPTEKEEKYVGTVTHMPPEQIEKGEVSAACDVYAFGILMWECFTGMSVYKGLIPPKVMMGVVASQLRPNFPASATPGYVDLARWCWSQDPKDRPTFPQITKCLRFLLDESEQAAHAAADGFSWFE